MLASVAAVAPARARVAAVCNTATDALTSVYPGDGEVDWVCADAYPDYGSVASFAATVEPFLSWASQHGKPVMIGEFGVATNYTDPIARWTYYRDVRTTVESNLGIPWAVWSYWKRRYAKDDERGGRPWLAGWS